MICHAKVGAVSSLPALLHQHSGAAVGEQHSPPTALLSRHIAGVEVAQ